MRSSPPVWSKRPITPNLCNYAFAAVCGMRHQSCLQFRFPVLSAKLLNLRANFFQQLPGFRDLFFMCPGKLRRIVEWPVEPLRYTGKNRASLRLRLAANGYYVGEQLTGLEDIKTDCVLLVEMSIPISCSPSTAKRLSVPGSSPALCASRKSPHISLSNAAAIWLRALLWTQMKRTFFFTGPMLNEMDTN